MISHDGQSSTGSLVLLQCLAEPISGSWYVLILRDWGHTFTVARKGEGEREAEREEESNEEGERERKAFSFVFASACALKIYAHVQNHMEWIQSTATKTD